MVADRGNRLAFGDVLHADGIDAVAEAGGGRAVVEDVAEVAVAAGASDFGADHAVGAIVDWGDGVRVDRLGKGRPTGSRLEFLPGFEERISATGAYVGAGFLRAQEASGAGTFGAVLAQDAELFGGKELPQLFFSDL